MGCNGEATWEARTVKSVARTLVRVVLEDAFESPTFDVVLNVVGAVDWTSVTAERHYNAPDLHEAVIDQDLEVGALVTITVRCAALKRGRTVRINYLEVFMLPVTHYDSNPPIRRIAWDEEL